MSPSLLDPNSMRLPLVMRTLEIGDPQGLASYTCCQQVTRCMPGVAMEAAAIVSRRPAGGTE